jgi:hypothetical protein
LNGKPPLSGTLFWGTLLLIVFIAVFGRIILRPLDLNRDSAVLLQTGQLLLEGKQPYVDFSSTNPVLIMYINAIPAAIANVMSIHVITAFLLFVLLLIVWSALTTIRVLSSSRLGISNSEIVFLITVFSGLSLLFMLPSIGVVFGQREHLFMLLYLPFFVTRYVRYERGGLSPTTAVIVGIVAAIGACVKPHFVLISIAVELYWLIARRTYRNLIRPEMFAYVGVGLLYAAHFFFLSDEVKESFFGRWLPFVAQRYDVYDKPLSSLLPSPAMLVIVVAVLLLIVAFLTSGRKGSLVGMTRPLMILAVAGIAMFLLQRKLFNYHLIPAISGVVLTMGILGYEHVQVFFRADGDQRNRQRAWLWMLPITLVALVAALLYKSGDILPLWADTALLALVAVLGGLLALLPGRVRERASRWSSRTGTRIRMLILVLIAVPVLLVGMSPWGERDPLKGNPLAELIDRYTQKGDPIFIFTTSMRPTYPMTVQMERRPGSRYLTASVIAMLYKGVEAVPGEEFPYRIGNDIPEEERRYLAELADDIAAFRPRLIIIRDDGYYQGCPDGFTLMDYLTRINFIERAMGDYMPLPRVGGYEVFLIQDDGPRTRQQS